MSIVWCVLEIPHQLPCIGIDRHDAFGAKIISGTLEAGPLRIRLAGAVIEKVQFRIVRAGHPHRTTLWQGASPGLRARFARFRDRDPSPGILTGFGIERLNETV